jgi:hypothetical protein
MLNSVWQLETEIRALLLKAVIMNPQEADQLAKWKHRRAA